MVDENGRRFHVEGDLLRLINPNTGTQEFVVVLARERAVLDYLWSEYVAGDVESGPEEISQLEPSEDTRELYQGIFGVRERVFVYVNHPSNIRLGGFPTKAEADSSNRRVGYVDNVLSPYENPDFDTEFFLRGNTNLSKLNLTVYNPNAQSVRPKILFIVNKMLVVPVDEDTKAKIMRGELSARPVTLGGLPSTRGEVFRG